MFIARRLDAVVHLPMPGVLTSRRLNSVAHVPVSRVCIASRLGVVTHVSVASVSMGHVPRFSPESRRLVGISLRLVRRSRGVGVGWVGPGRFGWKT